jgi:hypothetical protein
MRFPLGAGFSQNDHGSERFGINPRHQVNVGSTVFLPKLAYLNLGDAHRQTLNVEGLRRSVNLFLPGGSFSIGTPSQLRLQRFVGGQPPEISLQATHYGLTHGW